MGGKGRARPTEAGKDLIRHDLGPNLTGSCGRTRRVSVGVHDHAGGALDSGLDDPRGETIPAGVDGFFCLRGTFEIAFSIDSGIGGFWFGTVEGASVTEGGHDLFGGKKNWFKVAMEGGAMAKTHRTYRIAVVRALG